LGAAVAGKAMQIATVPQVLAYVAKGEVDAGFVNRTAARNGKDKIGGSLEIASGYPEIVMVAAVVKGHEGDAGVQAFLEFLKSPAAAAIMDKHGVK
ncbi:MAG: substrate-binding domain-containing protein, partial [Duodenibacillus sp.]|nr:substrate-binding domain-containing protein [Duodenibacillus sp.]